MYVDRSFAASAWRAPKESVYWSRDRRREWMEASIERDRFLAALHIRSGRDRGNEDQVQLLVDTALGMTTNACAASRTSLNCCWPAIGIPARSQFGLGTAAG